MAQPDPRWQRVARAIDVRMQEKGWTATDIAKRGGPTDKTLTRYLDGNPIVRIDRLNALCVALRWTPDSVQRVLEGGRPVELLDDEEVPLSEMADLARRVEMLEQAVYGEATAGVVVPMRPAKPKPTPPPAAAPAKKAAKRRPPATPRLE